MDSFIEKNWKKLELRELQLLQLSVMKELHKVCVKYNITYYLIAGSLLGAIRHKGFIPWDDDIDIAMMRTDYERFKIIWSEILPKDKFFLQSIDSDRDFRPALMRLCIRDTYQDIPTEREHRNCKNSYIDIFPLDNVSDNKENRNKQEIALRRINAIIDRKIYHIYPTDSEIKKAIKRSISFVLKIVPLHWLQERRDKIMISYNKENCHCVSSMASKYGFRKQIMPKEIYGTPQLIDFEDTKLFGPEKKEEYLELLYGSDYMKIPPVEKRIKPHDVYIKQ